jgi:hypothetical protein
MDDYDVVIDALQKHRDRLWDMTNRNMNSEFVPLNIMDDIRFYQTEQLDAAIEARKNKKEWQGLTEEEIQEGNRGSWVTTQAWESAVWWAEAKLKEKNA